MGCRALRRRLVAAGAGLLLLAGTGRAAGTAPDPPGDAPRKRLDFGLYGPPYASGRDAPPGLRFETWIEVEGAPARTLEGAMTVWWKHFDLGEQSVYGRDQNLRADSQPTAVNLVPLFQKLYDKLKKRK